MTHEIKPGSQFKKDTKKAEKQGVDISLVKDVINILASGEKLPEKYLPHKLTGYDYYECHIQPDLLLIYDIDIAANILYLVRLGSHSELFG